MAGSGDESKSAPATQEAHLPGRSKRRIKAPKRFDDEDDLYSTSRPAASESKDGQQIDVEVLVRRPLAPKDVCGGLANSTVFLFWPGDSLWYEATIEKIRVKDRAATVHYTVTDEVEEVDLNELMKAKEISVVESRRPPLRLGKGETVISGNGNSELDDAHHITPGTSDADDTHDDDKPLQALLPEPAIAPAAEERATQIQSQPQENEAHQPTKKQKTASTAQSEADQEVQNDNGTLSDVGGAASEQATELCALSAEEWTRSMLANLVGATVPQAEPSDEPAHNPDTAGAAKEGHDLQRHSSLPSAGTAGTVRSKVMLTFKESLAKAVTESCELSGHGGQHVASLAEAVEAQLFEQYGGVGKDYRAKYRSLHFNLKDPHNPSLRRRVLVGEISPSELVCMTPNELASKELSEWRIKKAAEFEKAVVVDDETAAKYSTAAAALLQEKLRKSGKVEVVGYSSTVSEQTPTDTLLQPAPQIEARAPTSREADAEMAQVPPSPEHISQNEPPLSAAQTKVTGTVFDTPKAVIAPGKGMHVSVAAEDLQIAHTEEVPGLQEFGPHSPEQAASDNEAAMSPSRRSPSLSPCLSDTPEPESESLQGILELPCSSVELGSTVWEGDLSVPGLGVFAVGVEQIGGMGDIAHLFSDGCVEIKGRVGNDKLEPFFHDLRSSRSRTVTLGIVRCLSSHDHEGIMELVKQFTSKNRSGVAEPGHGVEVYFVSRGPLTARFCKTASHSMRRAEDRRLVPANVGFGELLCITVHRKDWSAPDRQPRQQPPAVTGLAVAVKPRNTSSDGSDEHEFSPPPDSPPASKCRDDTQSTVNALPSFLVPLLSSSETSQPADFQSHPDPHGVADKPESEASGIDLGNLGALAAALGVNIAASEPDSVAAVASGTSRTVRP
mmetsp:Transcript_12607/g.31824  ORF Transcript_12607/g.31824 Transcript_12607/m.31824 type:complete len:898 (-) Transcript_12607:834-3527(-)